MEAEGLVPLWVGIVGYHSRQVNASSYLSQLACVALRSSRWVDEEWPALLLSAPTDAKLIETHARPLLDSSVGRAPLKRLCSKAPSLPKEPYLTHSLSGALLRMRKRNEEELLRKVLQPLPPRYPTPPRGSRESYGCVR